ncbi:MAG TPA: glycosyltransferase family 4 protein, partial [Tichowtungia sp.]|nr:glycosyltransferase family 4 protein [Tichowtungia sp.]
PRRFSGILGKRRLRRAAFAWHLRDAIRRTVPDLVYIRNLASFGLSTAFVKERKSPPIICEMHSATSLDGDSFEKRLFLRSARRLPLLKIVTNTRRLAEDLKSRIPFVPAIECAYLSAPDHYAASQVPAEDNELIAFSKKKPGQLSIGYMGNLDLDGKRGTGLLLEIAAKCPDMAFYLIGGSDNAITYWKRSAVGQDNVLFIPRVPMTRVAASLESLDVAVSPLQRRFHATPGKLQKCSFPLKISDYMSAGKAMVVSDVEGHSELLRDQFNCLKAAPTDADAWVRCLRRLEADCELRNRLGREARATWEKNLAPQIRVHRILQNLETFK